MQSNTSYGTFSSETTSRRSRYKVTKSRKVITEELEKTRAAQTKVLDKRLGYCESLRPKNIMSSIMSCLRLIPFGFHLFFVEAMLIPASRYEWDRYSKWDVNTSRPSTYYNSSSKVGKLKAAERSARDLHRKQRQKRAAKMKRIKNVMHASQFVAHDHQNCQRVKINVSGRMYETQLRTLNRYPKTLLGDPERRLPFFDPATATYYFDRHRESFEMILYFYQSGGRIQRPGNIPIEVFLSEIIFFDLGDEALLDFRKNEGIYKDDVNKVLPKNTLQRKIWLLFEYPESSMSATLVAIISIVAIVVSITSFCIETLPGFEFHPNIYVLPNGSIAIDNASLEDPSIDTALTELFNFIEFDCVLWFLLEFVLRAISSPSKMAFCMDAMNLIDFIAIAPYFVQMGSALSAPPKVDPNAGSNTSTKSMNHATYLALLRIIRLVRVFRIFKLSRHSRGLQILGMTLQASLRELGLLMFFLLISVTLFASAVYTAESTIPNSVFTSIPHSFYWGIITMTTVGYGDMAPISFGGKVIGIFCAIAGVLCIALPVPVIVSNFNFFYLQGTEDKTVESMFNPNHSLMCCYLPGNGLHPDADIYTSETDYENETSMHSSSKSKVTETDGYESRDGGRNRVPVVGDGDGEFHTTTTTSKASSGGKRKKRLGKKSGKTRQYNNFTMESDLTIAGVTDSDSLFEEIKFENRNKTT